MKRFYKKGISLFLILLMSFPLCACKSDDSKALTTVKLNEVAHSIFYAPMYVAIEKGYFEDEGIELSLTTGFGADKTMAAVVSGDADVGFMGTEASIYAYTEGAKDHVINFAQLTQRAGNFVVARENTDSFSYEDMIGKDVLGGRAGGTPEMVYEYVLRENGVSPSEVKIDQSIDFGSTAAAFSGGQGDYTIEFEPSATALEQSGDGYVVASIGVDSGYLPYTAFCAKESYLKENADLIQHFTNALQKGMDYVQTHTPEEIANRPEIGPYDKPRQTHINDIAPRNFVEVCVDLKQQGLAGYDSWYSRPEPEYTLPADREYKWGFTLIPGAKANSAQKKAGYSYK